MSDIKRVPFQSGPIPTDPDYNGGSKKPEKPKPKAHCFRIDLVLPESTEAKCPEFNFAELLKSAEKKRRKGKKKDENPNTSTTLEEEDDDKVKDMAKYFESKYGKTKFKNGNVDLGAGYDESDSFIDNTDAYDEIVPEEVTTAHDGFYVNSGPLEFKNSDNIKQLISKGEDDDEDEDEDDEEEDDDDDEDNSDEDSDEEITKRLSKRSLSSSENEDNDDNSRPPPKTKPRLDNEPTKMEEG